MNTKHSAFVILQKKYERNSYAMLKQAFALKNVFCISKVDLF